MNPNFKRLSTLDKAAGRQGAGLFVAGDITKEDVVLRVFKETAVKFGRVDLVFCNAGISPPNVPSQSRSCPTGKLPSTST